MEDSPNRKLLDSSVARKKFIDRSKGKRHNSKERPTPKLDRNQRKDRSQHQFNPYNCLSIKHPSLGGNFITALAAAVQRGPAKTPKYRIFLTCPITIPYAAIYSDEKENYFHFAEPLANEAVEAQALFGRNGICDCWATFLEVVLGAFNVPPAAAPYLGTIFATLGSAMPINDGNPIQLKCSGLSDLSFVLGKTAKFDCLYATPFEAMDYASSQKLQKLRALATEFERELWKVDRELNFERKLFYRIHDEVRSHHLPVRRYGGRTEAIEAQQFSSCQAKDIMLTEMRLSGSSSHDKHYESDPRFLPSTVACRPIIRDVDGNLARIVFSHAGSGVPVVSDTSVGF